MFTIIKFQNNNVIQIKLICVLAPNHLITIYNLKTGKKMQFIAIMHTGRKIIALLINELGNPPPLSDSLVIRGLCA